MPSARAPARLAVERDHDRAPASSTRREATIPTTPGCQPSPATTIAAAAAWGTGGVGGEEDAGLASWRSRFRRSSPRATSSARRASSVTLSLSRAASARRMRPAALRRRNRAGSRVRVRPPPPAPPRQRSSAHVAPACACGRARRGLRARCACPRPVAVRDRRPWPAPRGLCRPRPFVDPDRPRVKRLAELEHHAGGAELGGQPCPPSFGVHYSAVGRAPPGR